MEDVLLRHRNIWNSKKILRDIYKDWYKKIISDLKLPDNKTIELGGGSGNFKEFYPGVISSDIEKQDWLDMSFDAHEMPFDDDSVTNIVMLDVFHHLADPVRFLNEAFRVLEKGGRLIMLEPFPSPVSYFVYKFLHPEPLDFRKDYFSVIYTEEKDPWDSNQAIPYLIFYKHSDKFIQLFGSKFLVLKKEKLSCVIYPLSGGFENRSLIPESLTGLFFGMEKIFSPLKSLMAFRCYIVLEKK